MNSKKRDRLLKLHQLNIYNNHLRIQDICHVADCNYKVFSDYEAEYLKSYSEYLDSQKSKSYTLIIGAKKRLFDVSEQLENESKRLLGINLLNKHNQDSINKILAIKFGEMKIVKSLFYREIVHLSKAVNQNRLLNIAFESCLVEKGLNKDMFEIWLEALKSHDSHSYKKAQKAISDAFIHHFDEMVKSKHTTLLEAVHSAISMDYMFRDCHETFETDKLYILPEVYIFKACLSQALVRAYGQV